MFQFGHFLQAAWSVTFILLCIVVNGSLFEAWNTKSEKQCLRNIPLPPPPRCKIQKNCIYAMNGVSNCRFNKLYASDNLICLVWWQNKRWCFEMLHFFELQLIVWPLCLIYQEKLKGDKILSRQHLFPFNFLMYTYQDQQFDLNFDHVTWKSKGSSTPYGNPQYQVWQRVKQYWSDKLCTKIRSLTSLGPFD